MKFKTVTNLTAQVWRALRSWWWLPRRWWRWWVVDERYAARCKSAQTKVGPVETSKISEKLLQWAPVCCKQESSKCSLFVQVCSVHCFAFMSLVFSLFAIHIRIIFIFDQCEQIQVSLFSFLVVICLFFLCFYRYIIIYGKVWVLNWTECLRCLLSFSMMYSSYFGTVFLVIVVWCLCFWKVSPYSICTTHFLTTATKEPGAGIAQLVVLGLAVHSVAGSILLWGHFR